MGLTGKPERLVTGVAGHGITHISWHDHHEHIGMLGESSHGGASIPQPFGGSIEASRLTSLTECIVAKNKQDSFRGQMGSNTIGSSVVLLLWCVFSNAIADAATYLYRDHSTRQAVE